MHTYGFHIGVQYGINFALHPPWPKSKLDRGHHLRLFDSSRIARLLQSAVRRILTSIVPRPARRSRALLIICEWLFKNGTGIWLS